jgi:hypothetical protein
VLRFLAFNDSLLAFTLKLEPDQICVITASMVGEDNYKLCQNASSKGLPIILVILVIFDQVS